MGMIRGGFDRHYRNHLFEEMEREHRLNRLRELKELQKRMNVKVIDEDLFE